MFTIEPRNHLVRSTKKKRKRHVSFFYVFAYSYLWIRYFRSTKKKKKKARFFFSMFSLIRIFAERSEHLNY